MRQRIVINVEGPATETVQRTRAGGRKPRRWLRVLAVLAGLMIGLVAIVLLLSFLWWRNYQAKPAYTVALLADAAQRNDMAEFDKHVNYDEIAKNMGAIVSQKAAGRYGVALNSSVQAQIDKQVPALPGLKQTIHDEVVKDVTQFASGVEPRGFIPLIFLLPRFTTITTEGDTAKANARLLDREIELGMKRNADGWQVTEFKDDAVVQRVVDSVMKTLPAIGSIDSNSPLFKKPARRRHR
jgi:uncharacterized iron-regulated membrane protein